MKLGVLLFSVLALHTNATVVGRDESLSFPDISQTFHFREMRLGKASFAFRTNAEKSAEIVQLMYDVIRKTHCRANSRLSRNFSYYKEHVIMRPAYRVLRLRVRRPLLVPLFKSSSPLLYISHPSRYIFSPYNHVFTSYSVRRGAERLA